MCVCVCVVLRHLLDFLDGFYAEVTNVAAVKLVVLPVEAALERVAETLRADFTPSACVQEHHRRCGEKEKLPGGNMPPWTAL